MTPLEINKNEIWVPIVNYKDLYEVSNYGNIRRLRQINRQINIPRISYLRPRLRSNYLSVCLSKNGKAKHFSIHTLVYSSFKNKIGEKLTINHINHNRFDNSIENLEIVSRSDNTKKAWLAKRHKVGQDHRLAKHTEVIVKKMLVDLKIMRQVDIAKKYNVSQVYVNRLKKGLMWKHLQNL